MESWLNMMQKMESEVKAKVNAMPEETRRQIEEKVDLNKGFFESFSKMNEAIKSLNDANSNNTRK